MSRSRFLLVTVLVIFAIGLISPVIYMNFFYVPNSITVGLGDATGEVVANAKILVYGKSYESGRIEPGERAVVVFPIGVDADYSVQAEFVAGRSVKLSGEGLYITSGMDFTHEFEIRNDAVVYMPCLNLRLTEPRLREILKC